jgi:hypothetical protein
MRTLLQARRKWGFMFTPILVVVLICCYGAIAKARRPDSREASDAPHVSPETRITDRNSHHDTDEDDDAEYAEKSREFLSRFGTGPGSVSANAYVSAVDAARALPPSPLLQRRRLVSPDTSPIWTFPVLSPLWNDWGNLGAPCTVPLPPNSPCGGSARIDAIAVDPTNANTVYVGSEGGLARSTNGGSTWAYLSDAFDSQSIRSLAIDPNAPNIIYAGTGIRAFFGKGIYRSVDSGATWTVLGGTEFSGKTVVKIAIDPATAGSETSTTLYASVIDYVSEINDHHSVWKSTDSGSHWMQLRIAAGVLPWSFYDIAIDPASADTVYVTAPDGVFKLSSSGGWSQIHNIPNATAPSCLAIAQSVLYLAYRDGSLVIIKSNDQGANWSAPLPNSGADLFCFGVDPVHPERIFVGGGGDLRYSLDSGASWISSHDVHVDIHSIAFCPTNTGRNYLGTDGGIYRADYVSGNSITWYSKNENLAGVLMQGVSISSDDSMVMGNQDNGTQLYALPAPNPPWATIHGGDGYKPRIDPNNSNKLYYQGFSYGGLVCNGWQALIRVVNGVQTDITPTAACGERSQGFAALFMASSDSARIIVGFKNVYRSTNSGNAWTRIGPNGVDTDPGGASTALYEAPSSTNVIYAVFDRLRVFVTSNAGQGNSATWIQLIDGYEGLGLISAITVDPTDWHTAYIASDTAVWKTTNSGTTWTPHGIPNLLYQDVAIDPNDPQHIFAASFAGVYASADGGLTWESMSAGIPAGMEVTSLSLNATSRHLAASTYGRGAYVMNLPSPTISISGSVIYCSNPSLNPLPGATMTLTGSASGSTLSDGLGNYTFSAIAAGGNYTVTPGKASLAPGSAGISTADVLVVQRHYINVTPIPPGCRLTAADVNGDSNVTTVDVIAIQRFFLGLSTGIANVGKYQFSPASRTYSGIVSNQAGQNYDTIAFGDVASPFAH